MASRGSARGTRAAAVLVALLAAAFAGNARAEHVAPVPVPDNPSCADLGYAAGLRIDPVSGTYTIPGTGHTVTVQTDGTFLDWSSAAGLDAVVAKGSPDGNLYRYEPRANGDTGLHAPINPVTGRPYALSHVDLCLGTPPPPVLQLQVSKTAATGYTRTFGWQLTKDVDKNSHSGQAGNSFASTYTVALTRSVAESAFAVAGEITIHNPTGVGATITGIADSAGGTPAQVSCSLPQDLAPGGTLVCPYTLSLGSKANGTNTVTVQTSGLVAGASATADYAFGEPTSVVGDASVVVTDTDPAGPRDVTVTGDQTFSYGKSFSCSTNAAEYSGGRRVVSYQNTVAATGPSTNLTATKTVQVDCLLPAQSGSGAGAAANVAVAISPDVVTAPVGSQVLFTVTVTNRGGVPVSGVTANGSISLVSIQSLNPNQGTCSRTTGSFTCSLGTLDAGASATIQIVARILSGGNVLASANASADNQAQSGASAVVLAIGQLPKPELGVSVNLFPVKGVVLVNGKPLTQGINVPVGAKVDTRKGIASLESFHGTFRFKNGLFQVRERRVRRGVTELKLLGGNFRSACGHPARALSAAGGGQTHEKKVVRRLWGNGKGSFRTTGKYSSATVRGTFYLTADRCDGTLTRVVRGRVVVTDFVLKKNVVLRAGQSYLAKPKSLRR